MFRSFSISRLLPNRTQPAGIVPHPTVIHRAGYLLHSMCGPLTWPQIPEQTVYTIDWLVQQAQRSAPALPSHPTKSPTTCWPQNNQPTLTVSLLLLHHCNNQRDKTTCCFWSLLKLYCLFVQSTTERYLLSTVPSKLMQSLAPCSSNPYRMTATPSDSWKMLRETCHPFLHAFSLQSRSYARTSCCPLILPDHWYHLCWYDHSAQVATKAVRRC